MRIHHASMTVKNLEESVRFYESLFGFTVAKRFERPDLKGKAAFLELQGQLIELWEFSDMKDAGGNLEDLKAVGIRHVAIEVKDLNHTLEVMRQKGIITSPGKSGASGGRYSFISDPSGIPIEIYESGR